MRWTAISRRASRLPRDEHSLENGPEGNRTLRRGKGGKFAASYVRGILQERHNLGQRPFGVKWRIPCEWKMQSYPRLTPGGRFALRHWRLQKQSPRRFHFTTPRRPRQGRSRNSPPVPLHGELALLIIEAPQPMHCCWPGFPEASR